MPASDLKFHVQLTAERLAELLAEMGETWVPVCEENHLETQYAEYLTWMGELLCSGCTFCRECGKELEHRECENFECRLYLKDARAKDA